ncbi:MAG TPA: class II fructose-bisphosphatase, partial [Pasteurellaceae bacterium]|nr:class II fructose-bisphosphatase [Pasteurellaceae bacterium]
MTAMGQSNALSVLAAGGKNTFLRAPDMYMEKLVVGPEAKGMIDLELPLEPNLRRVASRMGKLLSQLTVMVLAKPRHTEIIKKMQKLGVRVMAIPDGDVAGSVLCCLPDGGVDMLYGIGGAPEGVISAAAIRALGGDMQARLIPRHQVKGDTPENQAIAAEETRRCEEMGIDVNKVLRLEDLVRDDNLVFSATGITSGELLKGIRRKDNLATTETLLIRGRSRTIRRIQSTHYLDRKDDEIYRLIGD